MIFNNFRNNFIHIITYICLKTKGYILFKKKINHQSKAFTTCYNNNKDKFDWFLMVDMDEFLYIKDNTLKDYLSHYSDLNPIQLIECMQIKLENI